MATLTVFWYVIIGGIAIAMGVLWFVLEKKIKEDEVDDRVEPDLNDLFNDYIESEESDIELTSTTMNHQKESGFKEHAFSATSMKDDNVSFQHEETFEFENETMLNPSADKIEIDAQVEEFMTEKSFISAENLDIFEDFDVDGKIDKPIFETNKPSLLGRLKGIFSKKERVEYEENDSGLLINPDTGETIIPRPSVVKTVALILQAPADQPYQLDEVLEIAEQQQLVIGEDGFLMHVTTTHYGEEPTYSIAHLLHPGSFKADGIEEMDLPGLLFFANIPGPDPEIDTIEYLVSIAATFGSALGGTLFDDQGNAVTEESLKILYDEIHALDKEEWDRAISEYY